MLAVLKLPVPPFASVPERRMESIFVPVELLVHQVGQIHLNPLIRGLNLNGCDDFASGEPFIPSSTPKKPPEAGLGSTGLSPGEFLAHTHRVS